MPWLTITRRFIRVRVPRVLRAPTEGELARFKVPLDPAAVRKKGRTLRSAMLEESELFEEADLHKRQEQEEGRGLRRATRRRGGAPWRATA